MDDQILGDDHGFDDHDLAADRKGERSEKQKRELDQELADEMNGGARTGWGAWGLAFILPVRSIFSFKPFGFGLIITGLFRRKRKQNQGTLTGRIDTPTTGQLLKTWDDITLRMVHLEDQPILRHIPPLNPWRIRSLELLGLPAGVSPRLAEN